MPRFRKGEEELITHFDKWLYVLKNLHKLRERPQKLQEKVFEKLFNEAEVAQLTPEDMRTYEESLKVYRDNYSILETMKREGRQEGKIEGASERTMEIAREMKKDKQSVEVIMKYTGLTREQIESL